MVYLSPIISNRSLIYLRFIFDKYIYTDEYFTSVRRAAYYNLIDINFLIVYLLLQETFVPVVHTFVTSLIDYCDSPFCGISDYGSNQLQRIRNDVCLMVTNSFKCDLITPMFQKLQSLPIYINTIQYQI